MVKIGFRQGVLVDESRRSWTGDNGRPVIWTAWYPAPNTVSEKPLDAGPPDEPFFRITIAAVDAPLAEISETFPVILLSHGTGGSVQGLGWLAEPLARKGYVVIGVNHHGNTAAEPYRAEGFLCWWERPRDLTFALNALSAEGPFFGRLDHTRVGAAGFSLGGYSAMCMLGAITDMALFQTYCGTQPVRYDGPREFPDLSRRVSALLETSEPFRQSWERASDDYRDPRVRTAFLMAPAPTLRGFREESLKQIDAPVDIVCGGADTEAPAECSIWLAERLVNGRFHSLGDNIGHYVFLSEPTEAWRQVDPEICIDPPGVDRRELHHLTVAMALDFFSRQFD